MEARSCLAIVLAAGEGTRMRSARPKVLHSIAGRSLLAHVLAAVAEAGVTATAVIVGPGQEAVAAEAQRTLPDAQCFVQRERRGTAHAVLAAKSAIERQPDDILVVYGDTP
ncbi:MAG TPA: NTP transferase domain-containing protein, partial [Xanthobacteraceae bacterium]|nr:NTP transferase domain-containing protein [Xanthobacteraceae bacterium]